MKKITLFLLFLTLCTNAFNQVVKGTIFDQKTDSVICFASVYFNGTFVGTTSDVHGNFELNILKNTSMPLTISAVGYYSVTLNDFSTNEPLIIYLKPKIYDLGEVGIKSKSLERKRRRNLVLFKEEFLGTTDNAQECAILNEKDITFNYESDDDTVKAFALKPILVENRALGYKITYYLDKFEFYKSNQATFFCGNIIFKEDVSTQESQKQFAVARERAYFGSRMHFFRTLWANDLHVNGFTITNSNYQTLRYKEIVIQHYNNKYLSFAENLYVNYNKGFSYIQFLKKNVYFDKTGYFDPSGINWKGRMAVQRIADWLPYEYSVE